MSPFFTPPFLAAANAGASGPSALAPTSTPAPVAPARVRNCLRSTGFSVSVVDTCVSLYVGMVLLAYNAAVSMADHRRCVIHIRPVRRGWRLRTGPSDGSLAVDVGSRDGFRGGDERTRARPAQ